MEVLLPAISTMVHFDFGERGALLFSIFNYHIAPVIYWPTLQLLNVSRLLHLILLPFNLFFQVHDWIQVFNLNQLLLVLFIIINNLGEDIIATSFIIIAHLKTSLKQSTRQSSFTVHYDCSAAGRIDV